MTQIKRSIIAWSFFDWANSSFATIVTTFVFATYFIKSIAQNEIIGTRQWGDTMAIAGLVVAILSPIFGAIADNTGQRKPWLASFSILTILSTGLLWFSYPNHETLLFTLMMVGLGTIGVEIGMVFYNAMLRDIAPDAYLGRISGWAWGLGYVGGLFCLGIVLVAFIQQGHAWFDFDLETQEQIRICGPFAAIWFAVFSLPLFLSTPDQPRSDISMKDALTRGLKTLSVTLKNVSEYKNIVIFLIARMIYIDGLNTLFAFAGIYAAGTFQMGYTEILELGITTNVTAGIGAIAFAWLDDLLGSKKTIFMGLAGLLLAGICIVLIQSKLFFWVFAAILGLFVGPTQAASRTYMARLAPPAQLNEMFGLYALTGKVTAFIGPWVVGLVTVMANSQRLGMATILIFFLIGAGLLLFVKDP